MDVKIIKELTRLMRDNDLIELEVESADLKVRLAKAGQPVAMAPAVAAPQIVHAVAGASAPAVTSAAAPTIDEFAGCKKITSPIPGTAYLKANPDAAPYFKVGDKIAEGQVFCLIEAMKVFNEIKTEGGVSGVVKKICIEDGQPVEYGTVLALVG